MLPFLANNLHLIESITVVLRRLYQTTLAGNSAPVFLLWFSVIVKVVLFRRTVRHLAQHHEWPLQ